MGYLPKLTRIKSGSMQGLPVLRGGLFMLRDTAMTTPMSWNAGLGMLRNLFGAEGLDEALKEFGEEIKEKFVQLIREGKANTSGEELSPYTIAAKGHGRFLYDKGTLADAFQVKLMKGSKATRGYAGIALVPDRSKPSHSTAIKAMNNLRLLDILCQNGLAISTEQLGPEKVRKIMAWRAIHFAGIESGGKQAKEWSKNQPREGWPSLTGKPFLFIPPRPLFTPVMKKELGDFIGRRIKKYTGKQVAATAHTLGYEHWNMSTVAKHKANLRSINI